MEPLVIALVAASTMCLFATLASVLAYRKKRRPTEGLLLGLLLGPVGLAIEARLPVVRRPEVDKRAWHSFRSVAAYKPGAPLA